jgi:hypothetical protein
MANAKQQEVPPVQAPQGQTLQVPDRILKEYATSQLNLVLAYDRIRELETAVAQLQAALRQLQTPAPAPAPVSRRKSAPAPEPVEISPDPEDE